MAEENKISELINKYEIEQPNIFRILKVDNYEIRHSNFLAWLFDPAENHGLGNLVFKTFIKILFENPKAGFVHECEIDFKNEAEFNDEFAYLEVDREFRTKNGYDENNGSIDLVIKSKKYLWIIENKYGARETKQVRKNCKEKEVIGQLEYYWKYVELLRKEDNNYNNLEPMYIYLDINEQSFAENNYFNKKIKDDKMMKWSLATYEDNILPCLSEIANNDSIKNECNPKALDYIKDYIDILEQQYFVIEDEDKKEIIKFIENKDILNKYKKQCKNVIHNFIWWIVPKKYGKIIEDLANEKKLEHVGGWEEQNVTRIYRCVPKRLLDNSKDYFLKISSYKQIHPEFALHLSFVNHVAQSDKKDDIDELYLEIVFTPCQWKYKNEHDKLCSVLNLNKKTEDWKTLDKITLLSENEYFSNACKSDDDLKKEFREKIDIVIEKYADYINKYIEPLL